jgi:death-on-curing protein
MISIKEVEEIHKTLIRLFGGSDGIRDFESLESSLSRPFHTFNKKELHQSPINKAAALIESIVINHPFVDGNKRTGYVVMRSFLIANGFDIKASQKEKYDFVINIASGKIKLEQIIEWLKKHVETISIN